MTGEQSYNVFFFSLSSDSIFCITSMSIGFQAWCLCWVPSCCSRFLESLCQALNSYLPKMSGFELLKVVYYLCLLGHFPSALLEQLLQANTLEQFNTTGNTKTKDFLFFSLFFFFCLQLLFIFYFTSHNYIHLNFLYFSSAPKFLHSQVKMFQTVNICLRLDRHLLSRTLTVPRSLLGDLGRSSPSFNPWLSQGLQRLVGEQTDTVLQEMVEVEDFYVIGKDRARSEDKQTNLFLVLL